MKKVWQTKFGGADAPDGRKGDCWRACVASILELPLEDVWEGPACGDSWHADFNQWLARYGLGCVCIGNTPDVSITKLFGYHILEVENRTLKDGSTHAIVIKDGEVAHDPQYREQAPPDDRDYVAVHIFVPLDAAGAVKT